MAEYTVDELLEMPAWVIDVLPEQVPAGAGERYFDAEDWLISGARGKQTRAAFADVLIKLGCYFDYVVYREYDEEGVRNPSPKKLLKWVIKDKGFINVLLESENTLIGIPDMSTYMAVYNASPEVLELISKLAAASGLFVWKSPE